MCCFSARTEVHGTSIFARFVRPGTQSLVYQMRYSAERPTAMILPLPVALPAKEDAVRFKSLKEYPGFFDDLALGFPAPPSSGLLRSKSAPVAAAAAPLAVHDVGDYVATFVPSVKDFGRVDPRFVLAKDVWDRIPAYSDYGFAVFQLKELAGSPHPIALELDTRTPSTLFFPTVHIHDGTVHAEDAFDHVLYAQDVTFDRRAGKYDGPDAVDAKTGFVRSKEKVATFADAGRSSGLLDGDLLVHKKTLRGTLPNRDTTFDLRALAADAASAPSGACSRCDVGGGAPLSGAWLPVTATLAGLGWIIRRRDERRRG
jgi:hypothetical protein